MIYLQLQKAKLDYNISKNKDGYELESDGAVTISRNELLKRIDSAQKDIENDK